jgi:hypothetical protein
MNLLKTLYISIILVGGVAPCLLLAPAWGMAIGIGLEGISSFSEAMLVFPWGLSGLLGLVFFLRAAYLFHHQRPWQRCDYFFGLSGLGGILAIYYMILPQITDGIPIDLFTLALFITPATFLFSWRFRYQKGMDA